MKNPIPGFETLHLVPKDADPDNILVLSHEQSEAQLQALMQSDKVRAVQAVAARIQKIKGHLKLAKKDATRQMLSKQLLEVQAEQRNLLRDEILNACKSPSGLLDMKKLRKFHQSGSRNKNKN